jgi:hypothetical protein
MSALQFYGFDVLKRQIQERNATDSLTPLQRLGAGALAGAWAQALTYPLDFMRARLTVDMHGRYRGIFSGMWQVTRTEGFFALYRGLFPSLVGIMPCARELCPSECWLQRSCCVRPRSSRARALIHVARTLIRWRPFDLLLCACSCARARAHVRDRRGR